MGTYGRDTPGERPSPGGRGAIFVTAEGAEEPVTEVVKNGAGVVGFGNTDGSVTIYFEANKFNDSSLHKWENKVFKAYDRMVKQSPTVNKVTADADNFIQVGIIEGTEILVRNMEKLHAWLKRQGAEETKPETEEIHFGK
jgi:hypothetical protein